MTQPDLMLACIADYGARVRGKGYRTADAERYARKGIGLAPTNLMITVFGEIAQTPWGPSGDLLMMPRPETDTTVTHANGAPGERFVLCDLANLDGTPWACCPRQWLIRGLAVLEEEFGLRLFSAFEHEFHYSGVPAEGGNAYALDAFRQQGSFLSEVMAALSAAGCDPEMVMPEYGAGQFEVTNGAALGVASADRAVILREVIRSVARARGEKACFAPVMAPGKVGNGVHVHFSLQDLSGSPVSHDPDGTGGMSARFEPFVAGIQAHMPDMLPLTAASAISYERLQPNRWSAAFNNVSPQDREAALRICPLSKDDDAAKAFNVEYRASDASANPYLLLGALVWAGIDGLRLQSRVTAPELRDPANLPPAEVAQAGLVRLPQSLEEALERMKASAAIRGWMGTEFLEAYLCHKEGELMLLAGLDLDQQVGKYVDCL
ncbi:type I glutamate--ammonia ligase [Mangrovicoccus ximenensis]|uniref:glutamine synthetase n=1 Tax=Mangrovicoccus ximenensis TaxID=1911570 RepID=UPI0013751714|nr:glutamine synthetase [Mangrovicoccus ximenensis]